MSSSLARRLTAALLGACLGPLATTRATTHAVRNTGYRSVTLGKASEKPASVEQQCSSLQAALNPEGKEERTVIYQCPNTGQNCGGFADRLAGLLGATALALQWNATLRVDWPELHSGFDTNRVNWTYDKEADPGHAKLEAYNASVKNHLIFNKIDDSVGLVQDMNGGDGKFPDDVLAKITEGSLKQVYFWGNRAHNDWPFEKKLGVQWVQAPNCIFNAFFAPSAKFLDSQFSLIGDEPKTAPLRGLAESVEAKKTFSLALHMRMHYSDNDKQEKDNEDFKFDAEQLAAIDKHFACAERQLDAAKGYDKKMLLLASDSATVGRLAWKRFHGKAGIEVLAQRHTTDVHIDKNEGQQPKDKEASMVQALQMWWLLRSAKTVAFGYPAPGNPSGFPMSAALVATSTQKHLFSETCTESTSRTDLNAGRFMMML